MGFSVLISVYGGERPEFLRQSLESLVTQTARAGEVVVVKDGRLGAGLEAVLAWHRNVLPIVTVQLEKQAGLGPALGAGLTECQNELVARMDSDDICVPHRFEKQLAFLEEHPNTAVLGAAIGEFAADPNEVSAIRQLPPGGPQLRSFAKFRNPLNHMTVMFRKSAVLAAGGYREFPGLEDYDLWVRMLARGMEIRNLSEILVLARCGNGMARRRGGLEYARSEIRLYRHFVNLGFISVTEFAANVLVRIPFRVMPALLRPIIYRKFLREEVLSQ